MTTFTKEQTSILREQATEILKNITEGQSTRDIMAQIYVDNLDEKTVKQGQIMADAILESVRGFDADYMDAQGNLERFIKKFQDKVDKGKSCAERCNYWLKLTAAISAATAAMSEEGADRDKILQEIEELAVTEEEATLQQEKELREQAMEAIKNSGVMLVNLTEQAKLLEDMSDADEAAGMLIDLGNKEIEYRAIAAMLAYTKIKNGEFEDMPIDMNAAQTATVVCAEIEKDRIMEAVGKGDLALDVAAALLSVLGIVVLTSFAISLAAVGCAVVTGMFGAILAIPGCLMVIAGVIHVLAKAADCWNQDSKTIVKVSMAVIKTVIKGVKAAAVYVQEHVISKIVKAGKTIYERLCKMSADKEHGVKTAALASED